MDEPVVSKTTKLAIEERSVTQVPLADLSDKELRDAGGQAQRDGTPEEAVKFFRMVYERNPPTELSLGEYCRALIHAGDRETVKKLAHETNFHVFDQKRWSFLHDLDELERQIYLEVVLEACQTPESIASLSRAVRYIVENDIEGDFVECGVYKGASIVCIIRTLQTLGVDDRRMWLCDTFEGMPRPEPIDVFYTKTEDDDFSLKTWTKRQRHDGSGGSDWVYCPLDEVRAYVARTGYRPENIKFIKGMVEETIPSSAPHHISLLRLDTDFYRSTQHELVHLYPRISPGGVLIIDDYGAYQGARKATDEYIRQNNLRLFLSRIDEHVRLAIKP